MGSDSEPLESSCGTVAVVSEWDEYAGDWDGDPAARAYAAAAFASLQDALATADLKLAGMNVLDFGCGTGLLTEQLVDQGAAVLGVDVSTAMLDVLSAKIAGRAWTGVQVATELPSTPASYQLIVCSSVCSFLDDYPATVKTLVELLAPGGLFVQWDWERDNAAEDPHGLSRVEIADALRAAGLEQVVVDIGFEAEFEDQVMRPLMGSGRVPASS